MPSLQTRLCRILDIGTSIVQASIDQAPNSAMATAVSNASGLGKLTFLRRNADEVRRLIGETREQTDRPFSANFILRGLDGASERIDACPRYRKRDRGRSGPGDAECQRPDSGIAG